MSPSTDVLTLTHAHSPRKSGLVHTTLSVRHLTSSTFVLRIDRHNVNTVAGQCVTLGVTGSGINREYSLYSGEQDDFFEFLIREIEGGQVSSELKRCRPGDPVDFDGPYGQFVLRDPENQSLDCLFIATGVGIAPYRSFIRSYPCLNYTILHGIRYLEERYDYQEYDPERYICCLSCEAGGDFQGRVSDYIISHPVDPATICYLCGNNAMIAETYDILREQGLDGDHIFTEIFF